METSDDTLEARVAQLAGELEEARGQQAALAASKTLLESELDARTRELTATGDVLKVISRSAFDLKAVLDTLTESAARLCGADTAIIRRREGNAYPVAATYGLTAEQRDHFAIYSTSPSRESVFGRAVIERRTIHVPDVLADPEYNRPQLQDFVTIRAMLGVPLMRDGVPVGVFTLQRREPQPYTQQQIELVTTFADQAVIAIENVRLFEEVQARTSELQESLEYQTATGNVLNVISRSPSNIQPVLNAIANTAVHLCNSDFAFVYKLEVGTFHLAASNNVEAEFVKYLRDHPANPERGTDLGRTLLEKRTIHVEDVLSDPEYTDTQRQRVGNYRSVLGVPLIRDQTVLGAIILVHIALKSFTSKQIELVETFADQALIAIENARLFEEVQARTAELQEALEYQTATSDVLNVISRSPSELQPVLDAIVRTAAELCSAEYASIFKCTNDECRLAAGNRMDAEHVEYLTHNAVIIDRGSVTGRVALERAIIHVPDVLADPEFKQLEWQRIGKQRTVLGVPLLREGALVGVMILARKTVEPFTRKQIELITTFADQAVIAIENVRLFEEVQARTAELQESLDYQTATSEVLDVMSQSPTDAEPVFKAIVQSAARLCGAVLSNVQLYDGELLHIGATHNFAPDALESFLRMYPRKPDRSQLAGRAILSRRIVHVHDVLSDPDYAHEVAVAGNLRAMLSVPMFRDRNPVGVITAARREAAPFSERQIELLKTFADQAVIAIGRGAQIAVVGPIVIRGDLHSPNSENTQAIPNRLPTTETRIIAGYAINAAAITGWCSCSGRSNNGAGNVWVSIGGDSKLDYDGTMYFPNSNIWIFGGSEVTARSPNLIMIGEKVWFQDNSKVVLKQENTRNLPVKESPRLKLGAKLVE